MIWNTTTGTVIRNMTTGHIYAVDALAVLPNGYLASGSIDKTITIWDVTDGTLIRSLTGHFNPIYSLAVLPNGYLASGSGDKTIKIWN